MSNIVKKYWQILFTFFLFILLTLWWYISPSYKGPLQARFFGDFPSIYSVMAILGAIYGISIAKKWGGLRSIMGKSIIMFSIGLFAQTMGQMIYAYYSFYQHISVPYPSYGDLGYFGSIIFYTYGVSLLAQSSGVRFSLRSFESKIQAIFIPLIILITSYVIFLQGYHFDWSNPVKIFLDFGYPFGQSVYISLALLTYLLSRKTLGGVMKYRILIILLALLVQYLADFTFLYQASKGTWYAGGINDYMYLIAYFVMTIGLLNLSVDSVKSKLDGH